MGLRNGALVLAQWKDGARRWLRWECVIQSGAITVCLSDSQRTSCVSTTKTSSDLTEKVVLQPQKPVWTSHRKSCFHHKNQFGLHRESPASTTKTRSDLIEKIFLQPQKPVRTTQRKSCFHHKNQFRPQSERLVFLPRKPVRTSQRKSCFNHKNQFGPHGERLVFPPQKPVRTYIRKTNR